MTDLAAEGDRLHAAATPEAFSARFKFYDWCLDNWPAIAAALRERDDWERAYDRIVEQLKAARVRAETAEADALMWRTACQEALAAHAAAVEGRP